MHIYMYIRVIFHIFCLPAATYAKTLGFLTSSGSILCVKNMTTHSPEHYIIEGSF